MFYSNNTRIDNIRCTVSPVGGLGSGKFRALFEREFASLEQIESIHWDSPQIIDDSAGLPESCGYAVEDISYDYHTKTYHVLFCVSTQYLGDVTGYQDRIAELENTLTETSSHVEQLEESLAGVQQEAHAAQEQVTTLENSLETAQADTAQALEQVTVLAGRPIADAAEARVMRMAIETAMVSLSDEQAAQSPSLSQPWRSGEQVEIGDRRYYSPADHLYKVIQSHTTQEDWAPDKAPALWAVVDITHAGTAEDPIPAVRSMEYEYGKIYSDPEDGKLYLCKRQGEAEGGKITLHYLPHELIGNYFEEFTA